MESLITITDFKMCCNREQTFIHMNCPDNSPSYDLVEETYNMLEEQIYELMKPVAVVKFAKGSDKIQSKEVSEKDSVIYCFVSLGKEISALSNSYFREGDYLAGMMSDLMSDDLLFQMDKFLLKTIKKECIKRKKGILKRLEAPKDVPMEVQKIILEEVNTPFLEHCRITDGYMYDPIKSSGYILLLTDDETVQEGGHNCLNCESSSNCLFCKNKEEK